jgi:hypothetical protein
VLAALDVEFAKLYADSGRPSIPPERLLRALLQTFYTIRSETQLMEQLNYNLLYRPRFVGLGVGEPVWVPRYSPRTASDSSARQGRLG